MTALPLAGAAPTATTNPSVPRRVIEHMRVLIVAGMITGAVVGGGGGRLAMLALRLTSPGHVIGVTSDDGFVIGRVTLAGTYSLVTVGAGVGVIGAGAYRLVAPWLIGPIWFRRFTTGAASAAVVGAMLLHSDGVDFTLLEPAWFAIGLFIALPAVFGAVIAAAVDWCSRPGSWTARGRRRWSLPVVVMAVFPGIFILVPLVLIVVVTCVLAGEVRGLTELRRSAAYGFLVRAAWLVVAVVGLISAINDVRAIG
jgi:hypothetical protein